MPLYALSSIINSFTQKNLEKTRNKNQIANALRQYKLANAWPLDTAPEDIAQSIEEMPGNIPVYLIIAPVTQESDFQQALSDVWGDVSNFFSSVFSVNSDSPVIIGKYKDKSANGAPAHDYMTIFNGLKSVPTLFMAPFSTMKDSILGITIAFWGTDDSQKLPIVQNIELDIRKLYVDEIRNEAADFIRRCKQGMLDAQDYPHLVNNAKIFASERKMLENGNDFVYLDKTLAFYKDLVPSTSTYISLMKKIIPIVKLFSSYIVDTYFVVKYNSAPRFPAIASDIAQNDILPALAMRGLIDNNDAFSLCQGNKFLNDIFLSYADIVARNTPPAFGVKYIPHFQTSISNTQDYYENTLAEKYFPVSVSPAEFSTEQHQIMHALCDIPEKNVSSRFSKLLAEWKSVSNTLAAQNGIMACSVESTEEKYERAKACLQARDIASGIKLLEEVASSTPQAAYDLGNIYYEGALCPKNYLLAAHYLGIAYAGGKKDYIRLAESKKENGEAQSEYRKILFEGANAGDGRSARKLALEYLKDKEFMAAKNILAQSIKNGDQESIELLKEITMKSVSGTISGIKGLFGKAQEAVEGEKGGVFSLWGKKK